MKTPSLHALRCFEQTAQQGSMKVAADALQVTPAAISQQITKLEEYLGVSLLKRTAKGVVPTEAGVRYANELGEAFEKIELATARILSPQTFAALSVTCTPEFASRWLRPRLTIFNEHHPDIKVEINDTDAVLDFEADKIDFAFRHGRGYYPGFHVRQILDEKLIAVCSPDYIGSRLIATPSELDGSMLLHNGHREDWRLWLQHTDASRAVIEDGPILRNEDEVVNAAMAGNGIALVRRARVETLLQEKRVVNVFPGMDPGIRYYLIYPRAGTLGRAAMTFRDWVISEANPFQLDIAEPYSNE